MSVGDAERLASGLAAWLEWGGLAGVDVSLAPSPLPAYRPGPEPLARTPGAAPSARASPGSLQSYPGEPAAPPPPALSRQARAQPSLLVPEDRRVGEAKALAAACSTLDELRGALEAFEGCSLKDTANSLCFADGSPNARLMVIGEAPGAEEDRQGRPFAGPSGRVLDKMLDSIGLDREQAWITNVIFWRPPGNRTPTPSEIAVCQPFLERQIDLLDPAYVVFAGGIAMRALMGMREGITKLRGREMVYEHSPQKRIPVLAIFHPAYLLRQPLQKKLAWRDLLTLRLALESLGVVPPPQHASEATSSNA